MALKILLTGSSGGIGSAIKERLKHEIVCFDRQAFTPSNEFDWLVCAHGIINEESIQETLQANLILNIRLVQPVKAKNVIFISSTAGIKGNDKFPIYSASKAALNMYGKLIGAYVVCPGPTDTPMWRKLGLEGKAQDPGEVAKVVERIIKGEFKPGIITIRNGVCETLMS